MSLLRSPTFIARCSELAARSSLLGARCSELSARSSLLGARCSELAARSLLLELLTWLELICRRILLRALFSELSVSSRGSSTAPVIFFAVQSALTEPSLTHRGGRRCGEMQPRRTRACGLRRRGRLRLPSLLFLPLSPFPFALGSLRFNMGRKYRGGPRFLSRASSYVHDTPCSSSAAYRLHSELYAPQAAA